jgi:hypothetical protein
MFPFVVGVTGHRDLSPACLAPARQAIEQVLESLRQRLDVAEIQVICGMADGADQLVADVALDLGMAVHAVLPMPREMYREDFTGDALVAGAGTRPALCSSREFPREALESVAGALGWGGERPGRRHR